MSDTNLVRQHLTEAKTALALLHRQKLVVEAQIAIFEQVIRIEQAALDREDAGSTRLQRTSTLDGEPRRSAPRDESKRGRIYRAIRAMLTEHGTLHRSKITDKLIELGLVKAGDNALPSVSSLLSMSRGMFVTDHSGNWSLPSEGNKDMTG